jgi:hypothetical protein
MHHDVVVKRFQLFERLTVSHSDARVAHVIGESVTDFVVEEFKHLGARVDEVQLDLQIAKHRCVLAANHAGSVNGHRFRCFRQIQDGVTVENSRMLKSISGGRYGRDPVAITNVLHERSWCCRLRVRCESDSHPESSRAPEHFHVVAIVKTAAHRDLLVDNRLSAAAEVAKTDFQIDAQLRKREPS